MPDTVTIIVNPDGSTTVGVECVKGTACKDATKEIERALGRTVKDEPTREMREGHVNHRR
jgi:hypothetical protein